MVNLFMGLASLLATIVGSIAAVLAIRRPREPARLAGSLDPDPALRVLDRDLRMPKPNSAVLEILSHFIFVSHTGRMTIGTLDQFEIGLFLDLFSACTFRRYRRKIAKIIVKTIRASMSSEEKPTQIAVPKEGNVLLADEVARRLGVPLAIIRTAVSAIRFGDAVEGTVSAGACVIIVDDIGFDGEMLVRTAQHIRNHGGRTKSCYCAVERMDGNSRSALEEHDVKLYAPIRIDERTLRDLARLPERAQPPEKDSSSPESTSK
jgi:orotate phosphoribosyltransferase